MIDEERFCNLLGQVKRAKMSAQVYKRIDIWNPPPPVSVKLKLWWQRLWVRKNEFHNSLNLDAEMMSYMCSCEKERYSRDLVRRRSVAHERDLVAEDKRRKK